MAAGAILLYIGANQCSVLNTVYFSYSVDQKRVLTCSMELLAVPIHTGTYSPDDG